METFLPVILLTSLIPGAVVVSERFREKRVRIWIADRVAAVELNAGPRTARLIEFEASGSGGLIRLPKLKAAAAMLPKF